MKHTTIWANIPSDLPEEAQEKILSAMDKEIESYIENFSEVNDWWLDD